MSLNVMPAAVLEHSSEELHPLNIRSNIGPRVTRLAKCTGTHRCWGASGDGRYEPLSQASDGLRREKQLVRQVTEPQSHYLVMQLRSEVCIHASDK